MPKTSYGEVSWDDLSRSVAMVESQGGANTGPRYEPDFERRYKDQLIQQNPKLWTDLLNRYSPQAIFSSYGAHQVMYPVAVEMGFRGSPESLADQKTNRLYFEKKLGRDLARSNGNLIYALQRYNGGGDPEYASHVIHHLQHPEGGNPMPITPPKDPGTSDPIEMRIRHINRLMQSTGFHPLTVQEIHNILRAVVPPPALGKVPDQTPEDVENRQLPLPEGFSLQHPTLDPTKIDPNVPRMPGGLLPSQTLESA